MYPSLCEPWPYTWCGDISGVNPEVTGWAYEAASEILWEATGRQFNNCPVSARPCINDCFNMVGTQSAAVTSGWPFPALIDGQWFNLACGLCSGDCSCTTISEVLFPDPVWDVSVEIDGVSLPASGYALYDGQRLVRTDGGVWPRCQDWTKKSGVGTWFITARYGYALPSLGKLAVGSLTLEIAKMCCGMKCGLPPSTTRVVRQGVTMEKPKADDFLSNGFTGLWLPDRFIGTYNPKGLQDRARMYSPDLMMPRVPG